MEATVVICHEELQLAFSKIDRHFSLPDSVVAFAIFSYFSFFLILILWNTALK